MESTGIALIIFLPIVGVVAAIGLLVFVILSVMTRKPRAVLQNGLTIVIIIGLSLMGLCAVANISTAVNFQEVSCLELSIEDHYKLVVSKLVNGSESGALDRQDGSERYQRGITSYAIERHYLVGQAQLGQTSDSGQEFFWVDLYTGEVRRFAEYNQCVQSLQALGFAKGPILTSIKDVCATGKCASCSSPRVQ